MVVSMLAVVAAVCAASAVWCWWPPPTDPLHRVRAGPGLSPQRPPRWRLVLAGRPDAAPVRRRLGLAIVAAGGLCFGLTQVDGGPGWWVLWAWPPLALGTAVVLGWLEPTTARRRQRTLVLQVPQALELLAACLSAGMPVRNACAAVCAALPGPVADDLQPVLSATALGVPESVAWQALRNHPQLGPAALDLARSVDSGTRLVEGLQHHAQVARDQRRAALQVRARAVGVRSVLPLMTCFIPSFLLLGVVPTVVSALAEALG